MNFLTVTQLNMLIQREISMSTSLKNIEVEAEISQLTKHRSGHWYFTIKDRLSSIDCVMFKSQVDKLNTREFEQGDQVKLKGQINLYEKTARLQFYVKSMEPAGSGRLFKQYLMLKEALQREGLFDVERKNEIPAFPKKIALLSGEGSAAARDYLTIFHKRNPFAKIIHYPITVQGVSVTEDIRDALSQLDDEDLIVITRGGGSFEDLFCFNDESLVRLIAAENRPVISAIGHEVDTTLIELVSDRRGATPTEAAEISTRNVGDTFNQLEIFFDNYTRKFKKEIKERKSNLYHRYYEYFKFRTEKMQEGIERDLYDRYHLWTELLEKRLKHAQERTDLLKQQLFLHGEKQKYQLEEYSIHLKQKMKEYLQNSNQDLQLFGEFLAGNNPLGALQKGYVYIEKDGVKLQGVKSLKEGDTLVGKTHDGSFKATVNEVKNHEF